MKGREPSSHEAITSGIIRCRSNHKEYDIWDICQRTNLLLINDEAKPPCFKLPARHQHDLSSFSITVRERLQQAASREDSSRTEP